MKVKWQSEDVFECVGRRWVKLRLYNNGSVLAVEASPEYYHELNVDPNRGNDLLSSDLGDRLDFFGNILSVLGCGKEDLLPIRGAKGAYISLLSEREWVQYKEKLAPHLTEPFWTRAQGKSPDTAIGVHPQLGDSGVVLETKVDNVLAVYPVVCFAILESEV